MVLLPLRQDEALFQNNKVKNRFFCYGNDSETAYT